MGNVSNVTVFCRTCNLPRYKSSRPLNSKDKLDPRLFVPVDGDIPPATEGAAACYLCGSNLTFVWDQKGTMPVKSDLPSGLADAPAAPPARHTPEELMKLAAQDTVPIVAAKAGYSEDFLDVDIVTPVVQTLFELQPGEELKTFNDGPTHILIVTTKRIVRVAK